MSELRIPADFQQTGGCHRASEETPAHHTRDVYCSAHAAALKRLSTAAWAAKEALTLAEGRVQTATERGNAGAADCQLHKVTRIASGPLIDKCQHGGAA